MPSRRSTRCPPSDQPLQSASLQRPRSSSPSSLPGARSIGSYSTSTSAVANSAIHDDASDHSASDVPVDADAELIQLAAERRRAEALNVRERELRDRFRNCVRHFNMINLQEAVWLIVDYFWICCRVFLTLLKWTSPVLAIFFGIWLFVYFIYSGISVACQHESLLWLSRHRPAAADFCAIPSAHLQAAEIKALNKLDRDFNETQIAIEDMVSVSPNLSQVIHFWPELHTEITHYSSGVSSLFRNFKDPTLMHQLTSTIDAKSMEVESRAVHFTSREQFFRDNIQTTAEYFHARGESISQSTMERYLGSVLYFTCPSMFARSSIGIFITQYKEFLGDHIKEIKKVLNASKELMEALQHLRTGLQKAALATDEETELFLEKCRPSAHRSSKWLWLIKEETLPESCYFTNPGDYMANLAKSLAYVEYLHHVVSAGFQTHNTIHQTFDKVRDQLEDRYTWATNRAYRPNSSGDLVLIPSAASDSLYHIVSWLKSLALSIARIQDAFKEVEIQRGEAARKALDEIVADYAAKGSSFTPFSE